MTSVLAMLYLVLFSALALGFYAQTNLGAQVAGNEEHVLTAQVAAESGLQFVRYQLSQVKIPPTVPRDQVFENVYNQLCARMDGTMNMGPRMVGFTPGANPRIEVPSAPDQFIPLLQDGTRFRATITPLGSGRVRIKTVGRSPGGKITRAIAMDFVEFPIRSPVLDYGVVTRGTVNVDRSVIRGSPNPARATVLSTDTADATPVELSGGTAELTGHVYLSHPTGSVSGSGTIVGQSNPAEWPAYVHAKTPAPDFPAVEPTAFASYLVGKETLVTGSTSAPYLSNIRIRAGTNPNFSGGGTYEGVILVEAPNRVTFAAGSTIRGVIVVANPDETSVGNKINIGSGCTIQPPETLPDSFGPLKSLTGSVVLAPNFKLELSGGGNSTFGGAVVVNVLDPSPGSGGTFAGPVISTGTSSVSLSGGSTITIGNGLPGLSIPGGLRFTHTYVPYPATYLEVAP